MMRRRAIAATACLLQATFVAGDGRAAPSATACAKLEIEPSVVRVAAHGAVSLHAAGGSGGAIFSIEGDAHGAQIEPGGGLRAGDRGARFTVVARDAACGTEARAPVEVVGPFDVRPQAIGLPRGGGVTFEATSALGAVTYRVLDRPRGKGNLGSVDARGVFRAGDVEGTYQIVARDEGSGREARLRVSVGDIIPLRPLAPLVAVPAGGRARLDFRGGSGDVVFSRTTSGNVVTEGGSLFFDARGCRAGAADVTVTDHFTRESATVRVLVGEALGAPSIVRGAQAQLGDLASGDVNGDGRGDLIIGHTERSRAAFEAGGILVAYGKEDGGLAEPVAVVEGESAQDHKGAVLLVADMNGDGIDDVIAGAPDENLGENDRGSVSIYLGSKAGLEAEADRVLSGEDVNHRFGTALAAADLDGDGAPELVTSAPAARSPFAPTCAGGRVYIFRNNRRRRGVLAAIPWQIIDLREPLSDDPIAPIPCSPTPLEAGRSLALIDMDGDKLLDLVVGAPGTSYPTGGKSYGSVLIYRGVGEARFEEHPSFAIHLDPSIRSEGANFGAALDVVRETKDGPAALVVRASAFTAKDGKGKALPLAGGMWIFAPGSLGPAAPPVAGTPRVRVLTTRIARAYFHGDAANRGFGRSAIVADVDPAPGLEYVVGAVMPSASGTIMVFPAADLLKRAGALTKAAEIAVGGPSELAGARIAALRGKPGEPSGLAAWAPWRTTKIGPFVGAIDWIPKGATSLANRWSGHASIALPNFGASDREGSAVALGALEKGAAPLSILGAPGAHSPASAGHAAGEKLRTGAAFVFGADTTSPVARAWVERNGAELGSGPMITLDFDGDGAMDLAVGDPGESAGGPAPPGFVDPAGCEARDAKGANPANVGGRGVVRIYSLVRGALVERFRVTAPRESAREDGGPRYLKNHTGASIAAADVNGDGMDDLILGRPGGRDSSGAEVVLGRKPDPGGAVLIACNTGEAGAMGALVTPPASAKAPNHYGLAVARLGDLDRDGCDEVALSIRTGGGYPGPARAGVLVAFGYDGSGARCKGHRAPFLLHVVPDDHPLADNIVNDVDKRADDTIDLRGAPTSMGAVLAQGGGDVTGDGVPDLVFRDLDLAHGEVRGPAVEIVSGSYLAGLCPNRRCKQGLSGPLWSDNDWHVVALRALGLPQRRVLPSNGVARGFGAALALFDLSGDGTADLALGWSDDSSFAPFAGAVRVFKGGPAILSDATRPLDPWLLAVGDVTERGLFGASIAMAKGLLLIGAPLSTRNHTGGAVGAAYRFEVPR